jgi:hypothetical protein
MIGICLCPMDYCRCLSLFYRITSPTVQTACHGHHRRQRPRGVGVPGRRRRHSLGQHGPAPLCQHIPARPGPRPAPTPIPRPGGRVGWRQPIVPPQGAPPIPSPAPPHHPHPNPPHPASLHPARTVPPHQRTSICGGGRGCCGGGRAGRGGRGAAGMSWRRRRSRKGRGGGGG